jgi:hypothetical protein
VARKQKPLDIYPVAEVGETMLTNKREGTDEPPRGEPWKAWLFVNRRRGKHLVKDVVELSAGSSEDLDQKVAEFVESTGAPLVPM